MKKNGIIFLALVSLLIGCYFGYKGFNLYYYDVNNITTEDYDEFIKGLRINDTITLKKEVIPDEEYLEFNDFKVKNEFKDFKKLGYPESTEDSLKFALYDENNKVKASFWMSKAETYTKLLKSDKMLFGTEDKRITNDDLTSILEENGITNDVELFKFLEKQKNVKNNIFTSVKRMKKNYALHFMVSVVMPRMDNMSLISGSYNGYVFNMNNMKEVSILKNDKRYVFMFINDDYFIKEYIEDILNTVVIK